MSMVRSTRRKFALAASAAALVAACAAGSVVTTGATPPASADDAAGLVCGTWVLQQVSSVAELNNLERRIGAALDLPGVTGLSLRFPWRSVDTDFALLDRGRQIATEHGKGFSIRFMAGRSTPQRVFDAGSPYYLNDAGEKIPTPFDAAGSPNTVFEGAYDEFVGRLADWSLANDVHLLHLAWYGQDWAELNNGAEVRDAPGYSTSAWLQAHLRLIDIGATHAAPGLAVELPLSGYGPLNGDGLQGDLADRIASKNTATTTFFAQGNGWNEDGEWGAPSESIEQNHDLVWPKPFPRGLQMIQPQDYAWDAVYNKLYEVGATYGEIYLPSFSLARADQLAAEIAEFAAARCAGGGGGGGDTTKPTVRITSPANGAVVATPVDVVASAFDAFGIDRVEFAVDGAVIGIDDAAPFLATWDPATAPTGRHVITAIAVDRSANTAAAVPVVVTIGEPGGGGTGGGTGTVGPPSMVIVLPSALTASVFWLPPADFEAAVTYRIEVDGATVGQVAASAPLWQVTGLEPSTAHTVAVRSVDAAGNVSAPASKDFTTTGCLLGFWCF